MSKSFGEHLLEQYFMYGPVISGVSHEEAAVYLLTVMALKAMDKEPEEDGTLCGEHGLFERTDQ